MLTFYGVFQWPDPEGAKVCSFEITYVAGDQPIMTWVGYSFGTNPGYILFGEPNGNKQIMYATASAMDPGVNYALFSTRQIVSVRRLN